MTPRMFGLAGATLAFLASATAANAQSWLVGLFQIDDEPQQILARPEPTISGWQATVIAAAPAIETGSLGASPAAPAGVPGRAVHAHDPMAAAPRVTGDSHKLSGLASYYWQDQMTATGERFDKRALTAAHKTLPFGTRVRVTRLDTGRSVVVRINDRGPYKPGRIIDLSERAAENLHMTGVGVTPVKLEVLGR